MNIVHRITHWYLTRSALPYWCIFITDLLFSYISGLLVFWLYYRGAVTVGNIIPLSQTISVYLIFNIIGCRVFRTYSGIIRYSTTEDLRRIISSQVLACAFAEIFHYAVFYFNLPLLPLEGRQILLMYSISTVLMWSWRLLIKEIYDEVIGSHNSQHVLIYGIHEGAAAMARAVRSGFPGHHFRLQGFISPNNQERGKIIMGQRVYANNKSLDRVITERNIEAVLVSPAVINLFREDTDLQDRLLALGVHIYVIRNMQEWRDKESISANNLKSVDVSDLLPRDEIHVDMEAIGAMLRGRTILITGSAGSIGSEMVRQIAAYQPAHLVLVDEAETPQHDIRLMMRKEFPDLDSHILVASITQDALMELLFKEWQPDYVFHAAAYKHVPMMEDMPAEAIYNNVYGTKIIADLSVKYGVKKFVMISTDKAVNPTNVMGCSKRICEIYIQSLNSFQQTTEFVTTRFGNVLGSNGSVIPIFEKQIREGGPVTVTDPEVTRFFMLIPEACELVLEAGTHGHGGQIFVFDMGHPVRIADLAKRMVKLSNAEGVEIVYTGLRPGEKLYEELLANDENSEPSFNKKIRIAKVRQYDFKEVSTTIDKLINTAITCNSRAVVDQMKQLVPEYQPANSQWG